MRHVVKEQLLRRSLLEAVVLPDLVAQHCCDALPSLFPGGGPAGAQAC